MDGYIYYHVQADGHTQEPNQAGWICPVCGSGVAPWAVKCPCMENRWPGWPYQENSAWWPYQENSA